MQLKVAHAAQHHQFQTHGLAGLNPSVDVLGFEKYAFMVVKKEMTKVITDDEMGAMKHQEAHVVVHGHGGDRHQSSSIHSGDGEGAILFCPSEKFLSFLKSEMLHRVFWLGQRQHVVGQDHVWRLEKRFKSTRFSCSSASGGIIVVQVDDGIICMDAPLCSVVAGIFQLLQIP